MEGAARGRGGRNGFGLPGACSGRGCPLRAVLAVLLLLPVPLLGAAPAAAAAPVCPVEIVGPDAIVRACVDPSRPGCPVYTERWGKEGEPMGEACVLP